MGLVIKVEEFGEEFRERVEEAFRKADLYNDGVGRRIRIIVGNLVESYSPDKKYRRSELFEMCNHVYRRRLGDNGKVKGEIFTAINVLLTTEVLRDVSTGYNTYVYCLNLIGK